MVNKQLSVFVENTPGRVLEITRVLKEKGINIISFSIADTSEFGIIRMIVSNPEMAKQALYEDGISCMMTEVLVVRIKHDIGSLYHLLEILQDINIEYMYAYSTKEEESGMVIRVDDLEKAKEVVRSNGYELL